MPEINQKTRDRLTSFAQSDKFNSLSPETQQRLTGFLGTEAPQKPEPDEVDAFLPRQAEVEEKISKRPDRLGEFLSKRKEQASDFIGSDIKGKAKSLLQTMNPLSRFGQIKEALSLVGGIEQRAEAGIANVGLEFQKGKTGPIDLIDNLQKGISGKRFGQLGDIIRTTGVGGEYNEAISSVVGFTAAVGATNLLTKGKVVEGANKAKKALQARKVAKVEKSKFFFKQRADMLADGADDVMGGIRQEFDEMYKTIGNNKIGADDVADVQEIVQTIPSATLKRLSRKLGVDLSKGELPPDLNSVKSIKGIIGRTVPKKVWSGIDDATELQAQMIDDYHRLNEVIAKNAGDSKDALLGLNKKFKKASDFRKTITKLTKDSSGLTKTSIRNIKAKGNQGQLANLENFANEFFPQANDILKDIDRFNRNAAIKKGAGNLLRRGAIGLGLYKGGEILVGQSKK